MNKENKMSDSEYKNLIDFLSHRLTFDNPEKIMNKVRKYINKKAEEYFDYIEYSDDKLYEFLLYIYILTIKVISNINDSDLFFELVHILIKKDLLKSMDENGISENKRRGLYEKIMMGLIIYVLLYKEYAEYYLNFNHNKLQNLNLVVFEFYNMFNFKSLINRQVKSIFNDIYPFVYDRLDGKMNLFYTMYDKDELKYGIFADVKKIYSS